MKCTLDREFYLQAPWQVHDILVSIFVYSFKSFNFSVRKWEANNSNSDAAECSDHQQQ